MGHLLIVFFPPVHANVPYNLIEPLCYINQPIILNDLFITLASVEGVQSVIDLEIFNRYAFKDGGDYEAFRYDISGNALDEVNKVVFPSLDPMIFELRFPDSDIIGSAIQ